MTNANDNEAAILLPLSGSHGTGKFFRVDAGTDAETAAKFGPWSLVPNGSGKMYVRATRRALLASTKQPSGAGLVSLSRLLTDAQGDQCVVLRDGDPLNLTRGNLLTMSRAEALQWGRAVA